MKQKILANKLNQQITFCYLDEINNKWLEKIMLLAQVKNLTQQALKFIDGIEFGSLLEHSCMLFICRYNNQINKTMRINFKQRMFQIRKIINVDENDQYLQIIALEL